MKRYFFLLFLLIFQLAFTQNELDSLLFQLEQTMAERKEYDSAKELRIKNIKELLLDQNISLEQTYYINNKIIKEYEAYTFDSTLYYIEQNISISKELKNTNLLNEAQLNLSNLLATSGRDIEAIDILKDINRKNLQEDLIDDYYASYRQVYFGLSFYTLVKENKEKYGTLYKSFTDSLLTRLDPNSEDYLSIVETQLRDNRQLEECRRINSKRLAMTQMGTRTYSLITFRISQSYELENNREFQKKYLILSAISDIKASVKDNASLTTLALLLFEENEIDKAHDYINFSFEDAVFFNSKLRFVIISNVLPVIVKAYEIKTEEQRAKLHNSLIIISLLTIILLLTVVFIYRQMKSLSRARNDLQEANIQLKDLNISLSDANDQLNQLYIELSESNHVKEHYIGTFLTIFSNYIDKLDTYRKMVNKKIVNKQVSELYQKTKNTLLIEEELKVFYENFDHTFLHIYPNFVEELNALLLEEERIVLKKEELLNTELRIFALIRLGISDSSKIAKLLRYSVNTIYNYRVKIKNKAAVPREDFEELVMEIGTFTK